MLVLAAACCKVNNSFRTAGHNFSLPLHGPELAQLAQDTAQPVAGPEKPAAVPAENKPNEPPAADTKPVTGDTKPAADAQTSTKSSE